MAKVCTTEKTVRRQEWIENGLLELMAQKGFEELTVTDLCGHLSLSRRSFYRYFHDLEDVLDSALDHVFQSMVPPTVIPGYGELVRIFSFWKEHRNILDALHNSTMTEKLYEYIARYSVPAKPEPAGAGELKTETAVFAIAGSLALVIVWYQSGFSKSPEEMATVAERMLFYPLLEQK